MNRRSFLTSTSITIVVLAAVALAIGVFLSRSAPPAIADEPSKCEYCHEDIARLSEASDTPEKLYVDPVQFAQEAHGGIACTACHGCDTTQKNPEQACTNGHAYQNPADPAVVSKTCGSCHPEITARSVKSIHTSISGIKTSLIDLLGEKEGTAHFKEACNTCHATCSSCHMEEPDRRNILWPRVTSHHFETKSNSKSCAVCHAGMGDTFFGTTTAPKHAPSLMAQAGMQCTDCHGDQDVHGTGTKTTFSMQSPKPECQECHNTTEPRVTSVADTRVAPQYSLETPAHKLHPESELSCPACHTVWYPNCWSCHDNKSGKQDDRLYLAISPLTQQVVPVAHSPASGPTTTPLGGGWAIKARHSWGASQTCETCHSDPSIYVSGPDRQAPFVGYWAVNRANASFVSEQLVATLTIDKEKLKQSAHKDQTCDDCHQSLTDATCTDCHTKTQKTGKTVLPVGDDWSRATYISAREDLEQTQELIASAKASGSNVAEWEREWNSVHDTYLKVGNDFHANPGQAQGAMKTIDTRSQALLHTVQQSAVAQQMQNQVLPAGLLFATGTLGAVALGIVMRQKQKR